MNQGKFLLIIFFLIFQLNGFSQSIVTDYPEIGSANTREAKIDRVELTQKYTIVYMSFKLRAVNGGGGSGGRSIEELLEIFRNGGRAGGSSRNFISISPSSKIIDSKTGRKFKYIKASGIPEEPEQLDVYAGEKVNFKVYYQRLDPGITEFDFYEGENNQRVRYWNFNNVKIKNPAPKEQAKATEEPVAEKETKDEVLEAPMVKAENEILLKGRVTDANTGKPLSALIYLKKPENKQVLDSTVTFFNSGAYKMPISIADTYELVVSAPGYLSSKVALGAVSASVVQDINLKPLVAGDVVLLENIYFETAQYALLETSFAELDRVVGMMQLNPNLKILLEGHTDVVGDKNSNQILSEQRVKAVKDYLVQKGIAAERIETKGWGSTKPLNTNGTEAERSKNRRVEFRVLTI